jgi:hypothetical protein
MVVEISFDTEKLKCKRRMADICFCIIQDNKKKTNLILISVISVKIGLTTLTIMKSDNNMLCLENYF